MSKIKVLFLAANPKDTSRLALDEEIRSIDEKIRSSEYRDSLELVSAWAVRADDLLQSLNRHKPHIVHFSGHGTTAGEIILTDKNGNSRPVTKEGIRLLFEHLKNNIRLVLLNLCFSRAQAEAITEIIDCAIGMNTAVGDEAAIVFAASFYRAIGFGCSVENAFEQGRTALCLEGIPEEKTPELLVRRWVDPSKIFLVSSSGSPIDEISSKNDEPSDLEQQQATRQGRIPPSDQNVDSEQIERQSSSRSTNPTGYSFLSYTRSRAYEAQLLIAAQHDRGIPTCQNAKELEEDEREKTIRETLASSETANAILLLTPDMKSDAIRKVELSRILERCRQQDDRDSFFALPVLAGGLESAHVGTVLDPRFSIDDLPKVRKVKVDPLGPTEAADIARWVLERRVAAIHRSLPAGEPLRLEFFTIPPAVFKPGTSLLLDWVERFDGRLAKPEVWEELLLPALKDVADAIQTLAPERAVEVGGQAVLPAATALGFIFLAPRRLNISWRQQTRGRADQLWSIDIPPERSGFQPDLRDGQVSAQDLAVLVSARSDVELAFGASRQDLPPFRAIVHVSKLGPDKHDLSSAGQASDVAQIVLEGIHRARKQYCPLGSIHLFISAPAGLAMMIGQLLNTFGPLQMYEHLQVDAVGRYRPAALLRPTVSPESPTG